MHSSRKIGTACYDPVAFSYGVANMHPDHDTLCALRRRFLPQLQGLRVQVPSVAQQMQMLKLGTIALDGTKVHANASRHNARSHGRATQIEERQKQEVAGLRRRVGQTDEAKDKQPLDIR